MTLYQIQDYGGIINHAEFLALGLKTLGHEVDFNILVPKSTTNVISRPPTDFHEYTKNVGTGGPYSLTEADSGMYIWASTNGGNVIFTLPGNALNSIASAQAIPLAFEERQEAMVRMYADSTVCISSTRWRSCALNILTIAMKH